MGRGCAYVHVAVCFKAMCSLVSYGAQIHGCKMGVFRARGHGESRDVALDVWMTAGSPFVSACQGKSGWEVWLWIQRGRVSGSVSSQEAPVSAEKLGGFWVRRLCVCTRVEVMCVY